MDGLEMAGDVAVAGASFAGLLLVFMGSVATSYEGYQKQEQNSVRRKYQHRIWFSFAGFVLALLASISALLGKWLQIECAAFTAILLLLASFGFVIWAAFRAALDVK